MIRAPLLAVTFAPLCACTPASEPLAKLEAAPKVEPAPRVEPAPKTEPAPKVEPPPKPEPVARAIPFLAPADLLRDATAGLRFTDQDDCEPPSSFRSFTTEAARWVHFANAWGKASAMAQCTDLAMTVRVDLYPGSEPDRRYVVFFAEVGLAIEELTDEGWVRVCDGVCEDDIAASTSAAWNGGYDLRQLSRAMSALEKAVRRPK